MLNFLTILRSVGDNSGNKYFCFDTEDKRIDSLGLEFLYSPTNHSKTVNTYSYTFKFDEGNDIFYSGDTYETNFDVIPFLKAANLIFHLNARNMIIAF